MRVKISETEGHVTFCCFHPRLKLALFLMFLMCGLSTAQVTGGSPHTLQHKVNLFDTGTSETGGQMAAPVTQGIRAVTVRYKNS